MPNHLVDATSPYLLQHAENPVDWYPWGPQALEKARAENKPIFLSIGYTACHWCHVMAHESFMEPATAGIMNANFVSIKVDREERPDLDNIYMAATQALTGSGGWPMSVFLTPDLRPFYAGTYFPPVRRHNLPSFQEILTSVARAWNEERGEVDRVATQVLNHLQEASRVRLTEEAFTELDLTAATQALLDSYDWGYGGWGGPPKFPQPMLIEFLFRRGSISSATQERSLKAALHALRLMARGGMYDLLGGGFARYSTDNLWRVPHFEKMLYDNALLAQVYLHAWQISRDAFFKDIAIGTLDFVRRELTSPEGGFYSSLDADSEGVEGKFYLWTADQINAVLTDESAQQLFEAAHSISERGNWEGNNVLQRALDDATLGARFGLNPDAVSRSLSESYARLLAARALRPRPGTDDKVLTAWNGLMLQAFSQAARYLDDREKAGEYAEVATRSASFLVEALRPSGKLCRSWRSGNKGQGAFLEDFGALINGLLDLYQTDFNEKWFVMSQELAAEMVSRFADPAGGFFDTAVDAEALLLRPEILEDNATPSGNSLACQALLRLAALANRRDYRDLAEGALRKVADDIRRFPAAYGHWLSMHQDALGSTRQIALVFPGAADSAGGLVTVINSEYRPNMVLAASSYPPSDVAPALLTDRPLKAGRATAYVCENFVCKLPVDSPDELQKLL